MAEELIPIVQRACDFAVDLYGAVHMLVDDTDDPNSRSLEYLA